jgi:hypothetical protein
MAWTTFAALGQGPATPDMLDANFNILTVRAPIDCTVGGTPNALFLTPTSPVAPLNTFQFGMQFSGIALSNNTNGTTASVAGFAGTFTVYKDISSGSVVLTGAEIVAGTLFTLFFDPALNGGAGGFHLFSAVASIAGGNPAFGVVSAQTLTASLVNVTQLASIATASVASLVVVRAVASSIQIGGGAFITRFNSSLASIVYSTIAANGATLSTVAFAGAAIGDNVMIGQSSVTPIGVIVTGWVSASGSIVLQAANTTTGGEPAATLTVRVTDLGFT